MMAVELRDTYAANALGCGGVGRVDSRGVGLPEGAFSSCVGARPPTRQALGPKRASGDMHWHVGRGDETMADRAGRAGRGGDHTDLLLYTTFP